MKIYSSPVVRENTIPVSSSPFIDRFLFLLCFATFYIIPLMCSIYLWKKRTKGLAYLLPLTSSGITLIFLSTYEIIIAGTAWKSVLAMRLLATAYLLLIVYLSLTLIFSLFNLLTKIKTEDKKPETK